ncbi:DNA-binding transcriptional LysR family regulator [Aliiruegeria haliotis]|uniref:DNA-binding transcriptional LysR family regulator n=1 Tax=Aliiruegeria haliotis TaxID=1280846 RepID=A0A2T0RNL1_9RHOB|nr:LysR family transcriptional regulator [Aliiruegeria haliotis]PRY22710.1 DNA-binding transcriptional LysR family regulator [Aliiruegeria haliotis]
MTPSWDDLRVFLAVARQGSLSGAGTALKLDPATAGRRIARLEEALGAPLFLKSPQGYALTGAGERLMPHAEEAEQAVTVAQDAVRGQGDRLSGTVRIGAPDGCANFLLPQVLAPIVDAHPGLEVQVVALPRVFNLNRREADMAIGVSAPTAGRLTVQKVVDYQLVLAAAKTYLAKADRIARQEDLRGHRLVGYIPEMIFDKELDYLGDLGVERPRMASNSVAVQYHMVRQGAGLAVVHDFALVGDSAMQRVLPEAFALKRSFYLIRHADDARVRRLSQFSDLLVEGMRRQMAKVREGLTDAVPSEDAGSTETFR